MVDIKERVAGLLQMVQGATTNYFYPKSFDTLPVISFYELGNNVAHSADDTEYSSRIAIAVDVWAREAKDVNDTALKAAGIMESNGFHRAFTAELFEKNTGLYHKVMRFEITVGG